MGMFSLFKTKGKTYEQQRKNDFAHAKGVIKKGSKLSKRDKQMIAVGRTHVHKQASTAYKYKALKSQKEKNQRWADYLKNNIRSIQETGRDTSGNKYEGTAKKEQLNLLKLNVKNLGKPSHLEKSSRGKSRAVRTA